MKRLLCRGLLPAILLALTACAPAAPFAVTPVPTPDATQRAERVTVRAAAPERLNRYGVVEGFWFPELTCELGVGWERLIFNWEQHQPTGPDDWHTLNVDDRWLAAAAACQREVVALLKHTPAWATDGVPVAGVPRGLYLPDDDPGNLWANFVRRAVTYYDGRMGRGVQHFIIWNEPDIAAGVFGHEFAGTLDDYAQMVKVAYRVAKAANPDAVIHLAGTTYWHDVNQGRTPYMERLIEALLRDPDAARYQAYFDVLSLHIYFRTDSVYDIVMTMREMLNDQGLGDKRIWINETNAAPTDDPQWAVTRPQFPLNLEEQAAFLVQAAAMGLAAGVERTAVYKLYDQQLAPGGESFGLLSPVDAAPRPAFFAWEMVVDHFDAAETAALARSERVDVVRLRYPDGSQLLVAWARTAAGAVLRVQAGGPAQRLDLYGGLTAVQPQDGAYTLNLPGARCDPREGCFIGGAVALLRLPPGDVQVQEMTPGGPLSLIFPGP
ncbi:MAG: hypothetical protein MUE40_07685 [Anaerolineae bacterium]|nr:hypothetical protein [Anaerolineae bacterium]